MLLEKCIMGHYSILLCQRMKVIGANFVIFCVGGELFAAKPMERNSAFNYNLNCNSKNVVYLIICKIRCVAFSNVGSTTTTFRFNNHRSCLQKIGGMLPGFLYQHFLSSEHLGLKHISIQLIDRAIGERELGDKEGQ